MKDTARPHAANSIVSQALSLASDIARSKRSEDHMRAVALAILAEVPVVGGVLSTLLTEYVPSSHEQAKENAFKFFVEKLTGLKDRLNEKVDKEDFAELWNGMNRVATRTNRELKLRAAGNILANFFLKQGDPAKCVFTELDHFMMCIDNLSEGAIAALGAGRKAACQSRHGDKSFTISELKVQIDLDTDLLMSLLSELRAYNLVHVHEGVIGAPDYENFSIRVTPPGSRFAERFIEGNM